MSNLPRMLPRFICRLQSCFVMRQSRLPRLTSRQRMLPRLIALCSIRMLVMSGLAVVALGQDAAPQPQAAPPPVPYT